MYDKLSKNFLAEDPEFPIEVRFNVSRTAQSYYDNICVLQVSWSTAEEEAKDSEGNVWRYHKLVPKATISSCYESTQFEQRLDCLNRVRELMEHIKDLSPEPVRIMTLNNEQREARDKDRKRESAFNMFVLTMQGNNRRLRINMRVNGRPRTLPPELAIMFDPGVYKISINDGSKRNPRMKQYLVTIPENRSRFGKPALIPTILPFAPQAIT
jgi:hypothetical protein